VFVEADGGTLFLDEIGDMPLAVQARLLRVLQESEVRPVGGSGVRSVDVRVIAATHVDLTAAVEQSRFRQDLFYRLSVVVLSVPPLRERLEDFPLLVEHFVSRFAREHGYPRRRFTPEALAFLAGLPWRGNVRELKNLVERLLILATGDVVGVKDVASITGVGAEPEMEATLFTHRTLREFREASEKLFLLQKLREQSWNVTRTAQLIETPRSNLYKKMEQYDIRRDGAEPLTEEEP
jgi:two-component system nitrogen regulation response regulator NtrX